MASSGSNIAKAGRKNLDSESGKISDSYYDSFSVEEIAMSPDGAKLNYCSNYTVEEVDDEWCPTGLDMVVFESHPKGMETEEEESDPSEGMSVEKESDDPSWMEEPVIVEVETVEQRKAKRVKILKELEEMRSLPKKRSSARILKAKLAKKIPQDGPIPVILSDSDDEVLSSKLKRKFEGETSEPTKRQTRSTPIPKELPTKDHTKPKTKPSTAKKSPKTKEILDELCLSNEFLEKNHLLAVQEVLIAQGLLDLVAEKDQVDKDQISEFFSMVTKEEKGKAVYLHFNFKGQSLMVTSRELAMELKLEHEGFDTFVKKQWPEGMLDAEIEEQQRLVCNLYEPHVNELSTNEMGITNKVLHRLLVHSFLPRHSKTACAQIQDILVLNKMLLGEKINWAKLFLHHLHYISEFKEVGYGRIVKKILKICGVYEPQTELSVSKVLTLNSLHRWGFILTKDEWVRKETLAKAEELKPMIQEPTKDLSNDELKHSLARLEKLAEKQQELMLAQQQEIADLKGSVQQGFKKIRKCMKTLRSSQRSGT